MFYTGTATRACGAQPNVIEHVGYSDSDTAAESKVDGRTIATKTNDKREDVLLKCLKGMSVEDSTLNDCFTCGASKIRAMVASFITKYPEAPATIQRGGGRNKNYDYTFRNAGRMYNIELKTKQSCSEGEEDKLAVVPWSGYGQLIQIFLNVKDAKYKALFDSFDTEGMIRAWFDTYIMPEIVVKHGIAGPIDYDHFYKLLFKKRTSVPSSSSAHKIFEVLYNIQKSYTEKTDLAIAWKQFCKMWMEDGHRFNDGLVAKLVQDTLDKKHIWICTTGEGAYVIEGPKCISMRFKELRTGIDTTVLVYNTVLVCAATNAEYTIEMKFRFYWKNGGQGVHNVCLQIA